MEINNFKERRPKVHPSQSNRTRTPHPDGSERDSGLATEAELAASARNPHTAGLKNSSKTIASAATLAPLEEEVGAS